MSKALRSSTRLTAIVDELRPQLGLAYLIDDRQQEWAVTRSTAGPGLDSLRLGSRIELEVEDHERFQLVSRYGTLT